ncbi:MULTISPECIES: DeoR/GlpR family DNA-binding transcription regulator [unclassified Corynebacterium]|uniref:DeoR/GlpR family DNA-binding transcription regulator n=1 Tax=unclassified Corynebacterium TaxID=2624378 RepID=UPI0029CA591B|nr:MULTISPECIES: DeoR/GlpR family DNA-binding transcription regulator [unclassified Corynebacterium]WPF65427.1 DeoR/GlpR family DNA-binding transcription regulator [Corynebacterium sp. 22KM0430]WPF67923.1 DeoR/GlpR family DNA-binding transcription regulator [Corynebacterium sp. 21KM1197]
MEHPVGGPEARQAAILEYLAATATGTARLDALAERFEVSAMTMHRDLDALAQQGSVERVRGGVRRLAMPLVERDVAVRRAANAETKTALARRVRELLSPGEVLALDDSTTVGAIAPLLPAVNPAAIITHSLSLLGVFSRTMPGTALIGLGGRYVPTTDSFLGTATCQQMAGLSADVSLISTTSVRSGALYHPDEEAARTKTACVRVGQRRILVCDSTKAGAPGVHRVADLTEFDEIVVDSHVDDETLARMEASGARLHLVAAPRPVAAETRERTTP